MGITHSIYAAFHLIPSNKIGLSSQVIQPIPNEAKHVKHKSLKPNRISQRKVLDRRKRSRDKSDSSDPEAGARDLSAIIRGAQAPRQARQLGIAGVLGDIFDSFAVVLDISDVELLLWQSGGC